MENETELWVAQCHVYDLQVGINVVDLGLIYGLEQRDDCAYAEMTLTTPGCPLHDTIGQAVQRALTRVPGDVPEVERADLGDGREYEHISLSLLRSRRADLRVRRSRAGHRSAGRPAAAEGDRPQATAFERLAATVLEAALQPAARANASGLPSDWS